MVVVAQFTKMAHLIGLHENAIAKYVADTFLLELWNLHGLPTEIISDMDEFSGKFSESLCNMLGVKRRMWTEYNHETDGQTERTNQVLSTLLTRGPSTDRSSVYSWLKVEWRLLW